VFAKAQSPLNSRGGFPPSFASPLPEGPLPPGGPPPPRGPPPLLGTPLPLPGGPILEALGLFLKLQKMGTDVGVFVPTNVKAAAPILELAIVCVVVAIQLF
jgi:hypothetical protein